MNEFPDRTLESTVIVLLSSRSTWHCQYSSGDGWSLSWEALGLLTSVVVSWLHGCLTSHRFLPHSPGKVWIPIDIKTIHHTHTHTHNAAYTNALICFYLVYYHLKFLPLGRKDRNTVLHFTGWEKRENLLPKAFSLLIWCYHSGIHAKLICISHFVLYLCDEWNHELLV